MQNFSIKENISLIITLIFVVNIKHIISIEINNEYNTN